MLKEKYIGTGVITNLGRTDLVGAFLDVNIRELLLGIEELLDADPTADIARVIVLPPKTVGVPHTVKLNIGKRGTSG